MSANIFQPIKDVFVNHRKFTPFQKVLLCSVFMGVLLCGLRSLWALKLVFMYTLTIYSAVSVTKYIVKCHFYLPSHLLLEFYETAVEIIVNIKQQLTNSTPIVYVKDTSELETKDGHRTTNCSVKKDHRTDEDEFYDAVDFLQQSKFEATSYHELDLGTVIVNHDVSEEVKRIVKLIHRDFIGSWYNLFTAEKSVLKEGEFLLCGIVQCLQGRLCRLKCDKLLEFILLMFKDHVHGIKQARAMFQAQSKSRRRRSSARIPTNSDGIPAPKVPTTCIYNSVEDCYAAKVELHPAVKSKEIENSYQRSIIQLLLVHLLKEEMHGSKSVYCALKEILMCNVLQQVMDLLCSTTFLHEKIIKITSDEELCVGNVTSLTVLETNNSGDNLQSILTTSRKNSVLKQLKESQAISEFTNVKNIPSEGIDTVIEQPPNVKWKEDTQLHTVPKGLCNECNRLCSTDKDRISPRPHTCSLGTTPVFFDVTVDPDRASLSSFNSLSSTSSKEDFKTPHKEKDELDNSEPVLRQDAHTSEEEHVVSSCSVTVSDNVAATDKANDLLTSSETKLKQVDNLNDENIVTSNIFPNIKFPQFINPLNFSVLKKRPSFTDKKALSPTSVSQLSPSPTKLSPGDSSPINETLACVDDRPSVFQDARLTTTETAKEVGSFGTTEYTLYTVEYEALHPTEDGEPVYRSGSVRRRFREFVNLQSRLEDNPKYKRLMKDIKGPKKILPSLPFGNMGKDTVDSRKEMLDVFLSALIRNPDLCNSEEMKQFLGYSGDGHIAFVRKVPENTGPRIDQRLVKTMSGVFDKIVEGLPSLPQQLPRIISPFDPREEEDNSADFKLSEDTDNIDLIFVHDTDQLRTSKIDSGLEKFTLEKVLELTQCDKNNTTLGISTLTWENQQGNGITINETSDPQKQKDDREHLHVLDQLSRGECPLSDAVLDVLTEALQSQDHWVCRDNVIQATKVLFGKAINRFLEEKVDWLTSGEMITFYLRTLREMLWPNGELSDEPSVVYTDLQKEQIKDQATRCLGEFLPGFLKLVLGKEEFDLAINEVMESLNYEKLNRHIWYRVFDVLLEELIPEINTQELQRKLSTTVATST